MVGSYTIDRISMMFLFVRTINELLLHSIMHHSDTLSGEVRLKVELQQPLPFEAQYHQKSEESHQGHLDEVPETHGYLWHVLKIHRTQTREEIQWQKYA